MKTDDLIQRMATRHDPIRRPPAPWKGVLHWFAVALPGVAIVVMLMSPRDDLGEQYR